MTHEPDNYVYTQVVTTSGVPDHTSTVSDWPAPKHTRACQPETTRPMNEAEKIEKASKSAAGALMALRSIGWGSDGKDSELKQQAREKLKEALEALS